MKPANLLPVLYLTLGWFGLEMAMALDVTQFQVMLDEKLNDAFLIGLVLSLGPAAGITVQPLIGRMGDQWARRGLTRRTLMKYGVAAALISLLALAVPVSTPVLIVLVGLFFVSFNVVIVCYRALVTETTGRRALEKEKGSVSGFIALFSGLGGFVMFVLCSATTGTPWPFLIGALVFLVSFLLYFRYAPRPKTGIVTDEAAHDLFRPAHLLFYAIPVIGLIPAFERRIVQQEYQRAIFRLFAVVFFAWVGIQALRGFFVLYVDKSLGLSHETANIMLAVVTLVMVGAAVPFGKLADRMDNGRLFRYSLLAFSIVCLAAWFLVDGLPSLTVLSILLGASFAGLIVSPLSALFKLCPARNEGAYAGLYNLFISVPQLYSLMVTGWLINVMDDYRVIMAVGFVAVFCGFLASLRLVPEAQAAKS